MPYGDVFIAETPKIDEIGNRIYAEERQRQAIRQQQLEALDEEFSKSIYKIRPADVEEYTKLYNDWKEDNKRLYSLGDRASVEDRTNNLIKKAAIYKYGNQSIEYDDYLKSLSKKLATDKVGRFDENAPVAISSMSKVPVSKADWDLEPKLRYKYSVPDYLKLNNAAIGDKPVEKFGDWISPKDPRHSGVDKLSDERKVYKVYNSPEQQYEKLFSSLATNNQSKAAINYVEDNIGMGAEDLQNKFYAKIKDPKWIEAYGEFSGFPQSTQTELGRAVALQVMKNVVDAPLPTADVRKRPNSALTLSNKQQFAKEQQARGASYALSRMYVYAGIQNSKPLSPTDITKGAAGLVSDYIDQAKANGGVLDVDDVMFESITGNIKTKKSYLTINEQGEFQYGDKGGPLTTIPYDLGIAKIVKAYPKISAAAKENTNPPKPQPKPPTPQSDWKKRAKKVK